MKSSGCPFRLLAIQICGTLYWTKPTLMPWTAPMRQHRELPVVATNGRSEGPARASALRPKADASMGSMGYRTWDVRFPPESGRFERVVRMSGIDPERTFPMAGNNCSIHTGRVMRRMSPVYLRSGCSRTGLRPISL